MADSAAGQAIKGGRIKDKKPKSKKNTMEVEGDPIIDASRSFYGDSGRVEQPMADYFDRFTTEAVDPVSMLPPSYFNRLGGYLFRRNPDGEETIPVETTGRRRNPIRTDQSIAGIPMGQMNRSFPGAFAGPSPMGSETIEIDPAALSDRAEDFGVAQTQVGMRGRKNIFNRNRSARNERPTGRQRNFRVKTKQVVAPPVFADENYDEFDAMGYSPRNMGIF